MVVDLGVPEDGLVTVAPGEVLGADVLVGVLGALLQRGQVRLVLDVLLVAVVRVGQSSNDNGDGGAGMLVDVRRVSLSIVSCRWSSRMYVVVYQMAVSAGCRRCVVVSSCRVVVSSCCRS